MNRNFTEKLKSYCSLSGKKNTPERYEVLSVMEQITSSHFNADDIYNTAQNCDYYFSRATIYRTLELFEQAEIIRKSRKKDGKQQYALFKQSEQHSYLHCLTCGKKIALDIKPILMELNLINQHHNFTGINQTVVINGYCKACRR